MANPNTRQRPHAPPDLHGNAPDKCEVALLLVDVINDFDFPTAGQLWKFARPAVRGLAALKQRAAAAGVPCIYANDNFGRWRSDFNALVAHVKKSAGPGAEVARLLAPGEQDYFVLKVKQSAFYETCLGLLLEHLGVQKLVIGGVATDNCVHMSANDAYLRGFELFVLRDGSAADDKEAHRAALAQMSRVLKAHTPRCSDVSFVKRKSGASIRLRGGRAKSR